MNAEAICVSGQVPSGEDTCSLGVGVRREFSDSVGAVDLVLIVLTVLPGRLIPLMAPRRSCFPMPDLSLSQYKHYAVAYAQLAHKGDIHAIAGL